MSLAGIGVERVIPLNTMMGLLSGTYSLHGGVVRDMGGRIVAHLATSGMSSTVTSLVPGLGWIADAFQTYQLHRMGLTLDRVEQQLGTVMQLSQAAVALSGLGVVVSLGGFAFLNAKLSRLEATLGRIERETRKTNRVLEAIRYSELKGAMDHLRHAQDTLDPQTRRDLLMLAKDQFGRMAHQYARLWLDADTLDELTAIDDGHLLAMVGHSLCTSALGMAESATDDFKRHRADWRHAARAYLGERVLGEAPQRLLHHRYVDSLPAQDLIELLDFVHGTRKGIDWVDHLRRRESDASLWRLPSFDAEASALAFARRLVAKDQVLAGYEAHFAHLAERGLSALEFQRLVDPVVRDLPPGEIAWILAKEEEAELVPAQAAAAAATQGADHLRQLPWQAAAKGQAAPGLWARLTGRAS